MIAAPTVVIEVVLALLMARAAWTDLVERRIANTVSSAIALLSLLRLVLEGSLAGAGEHLAAGLLVLALGYGLWSTGTIGGGDVKLAAALSLHIGLGDVLVFLLYTSLLGGLLAILCLAKWLWDRRKADAVPGDRRHPAAPRAAVTIPYGIAIVGAAALCILGV